MNIDKELEEAWSAAKSAAGSARSEERKKQVEIIKEIL